MQIATKLSSCLDRKIEHVKVTGEQRYEGFKSYGLSDHYAKMLVDLEKAAANGTEDKLNDVVERVTGRPAQTFDAFAQEHKAVWQ